MPIELHPSQAAFFASKAMFRGFVGGRGVGKSFIGAMDLVKRACLVPGLYMVIAPTYPMLRDATIRSFESFVRPNNLLASDINKTPGNSSCQLKSGSEILFRSGDDPERLRGPNLSGVWLDEASIMHRDVYQIVIACLREGGRQGWLSATFTPKGRGHWTYDVFGEDKPNVETFHARTVDNPFLPDEFEAIMRGQYPSTFARQELEGEFISLEGEYIKRAWFKQCAEADVPTGLTWWRGVDFAATTKETSDFTASVKVAEEKRAGENWYYIAGGLCARMEWPIAKRRIVELCKAERCRVCVEAVAGFIVAHREIAEALRGVCLVREISVVKDKLTRALPWIAAAEAGRVVLVKSGRGDEWIDTFLSQCDTFPSEDKGLHDDLIDAVSIAFEGGIYRKETSFAC